MALAAHTIHVVLQKTMDDEGIVVSQEVEVVYDPMNYNDAAFQHISELWIMPTILGSITAMLSSQLNMVTISGLFIARRSE